MNIHTPEKNNKLFFKTLTIFMVCYTVLVIICIKNKEKTPFFVPGKLKINRFTKIIVNLSIPKSKPTFIPPIKKREITKTVALKEKKTSVKKKIKLKKKPEIKMSESDIFELEMLKVLGAIDDSIGGAKTVSASNLMASNDFMEIGDTSDILFSKGTTEDILSDIEITDTDSETLESELPLDENSISFESKLNINHNLSKVDEALLSSNEEDEGIDDEVRTPHFIEEKVQEYATGIKFCYNNRLGLDKKPSGKIIINFTILSNGKTEGARIVSTDIKDHRLDTCIVDVVGRWKFPKSTSDKVLVTYPLFLSTDKT